MNSQFLIVILFGLLQLIFIACKQQPTPPNRNWQRNPNLKQLTFNGYVGWPSHLQGNAAFPAYDPRKPSRIYYIKSDLDPSVPRPDRVGIWYVDTSSTFESPRDTLLLNGRYGYLSISKAGTQLAVIESLRNAVSGNLWIVDVDTRSRVRLDVGLRMVYGVRFTEGDTVLIIYGDGQTAERPRGYYRYRRLSQSLELLFPEPLGFFSFDVTSDGKKLYYPRPPRCGVDCKIPHLRYPLPHGKIYSKSTD